MKMSPENSDDIYIQSFEFTASESMIPGDELISRLGYDTNNLPQPVMDSVNYAIESVLINSAPAGGFRILMNNNIKILSDHFYIDDICINNGRIINRYFRDAESIAIIVATIGNEPEILSKKLMKSNEYLSGYVIDIAASIMVEHICDMVEIELNRILNSLNLYATNRYSPGYCGWDVKDQHKLFSFLPKYFCGIKLTESAMMDPVKSVSAIIGIGKNVKKEEYECEICDFDFCYKKLN